MLKHILNDTAAVKSVVSSDEYNSDTYSEPKTIKCKIEFAAKTEELPLSEQQSHPLRMFCYEQVGLNDIVSYKSSEYKVVQVNSYDDLDGNPMFYEVFLQ